MNKRFRNFLIWIAVAVAATLIFAVWQFAAIKNDAAAKLATARAENIGRDEIPFLKTVRQPLRVKSIEIWQSTKNVRAVARYKNSIFAATDGGLMRYSEVGNTEKHYTVLDGLPESDLTALAVYAGKLWIGTSASGLVAFDGERFENYRWKDREAKVITALLTADNNLLIGTFAGGLIEFDGSAFRELKPENRRVKSVNFLAKNRETLFVGTFADGLWLATAGSWRNFTVANGLPSNRVVGVIVSGDAVLVGTDFGVARAAVKELFQTDQTKIFHRLASIPALSGLVSFHNENLAVRDDGEIFSLTNGGQTRTLEWNKPDEMTNARLAIENDKLWLLGNRGIRQLHEKNSFGASFAPFGNDVHETLSNNVVSALTVTRKNQIWAGTFRNGIDVLAGDGKRLTHLENENLREINFLAADREILAATAHGVLSFDDSLRAGTLTKKDGLLSDSVMHIAASGNDKYFATSRGLSFVADNRLRALTSVNGLPSNNVYATAFHQNHLFVGTLGGLAEIENERVVRTFKDSNSKLANNWVSALCEADGRLFVGTYGGGVFELTAAGELHAFAAETGRFAVNPNAMFADDARLYVGTLGGALVLDLSTQKWTKLTDELPATTVLSIAGDRDNIYFGTTNGIARVNKSFWSDNTTNE